MTTQKDADSWAAAEALAELDSARRSFPKFASAHEGFAILKEEVDELWDEVKAKDGVRSIEKMRAEAIQIAAMAIRFIVDVCGEEVINGPNANDWRNK